MSEIDTSAEAVERRACALEGTLWYEAKLLRALAARLAAAEAEIDGLERALDVVVNEPNKVKLKRLIADKCASDKRAEAAEAERDEANAKLAQAREAAIHEVLKEIEGYLPEFGAGDPQDGTDRIIDQTWRSFRKTALALIDQPAAAPEATVPHVDAAGNYGWRDLAGKDTE